MRPDPDAAPIAQDAGGPISGGRIFFPLRAPGVNFMSLRYGHIGSEAAATSAGHRGFYADGA